LFFENRRFGSQTPATISAGVSGKRGDIMKVGARFIIFCVGMIILAPGFFLAQQTDARLAGTWSGRATRQGAKSYTVTVILDGTGAGFIEYPNRKCGGTLRFVRKSGDTLSYQETITHGAASCTQSGRVDLVPSGSVLAWNWSAGEDKATATLTTTQTVALSGCPDCDLNYDKDMQACYPVGNSGIQQKCLEKADEDLRTCQMSCKN
jgi:hypothetical protein